MIGRLAFIGALLCASVALAQEAPPANGLQEFPIRPLEKAAADRAEADAIISGSGHAALFENASDQRGPAVRHRASGLLCRFWPGVDGNGIRVYEATPGAEDVSCQTFAEGASLTLYASQYTPTPSAEQEIRQAIGAIRQRWPDLRDYDGPTAGADVQDPNFPHRHVARGVVTQSDNQEYLTKVSVAKVGVWIIKQRMTVRLDRALRGDLWSESQMVLTLIDLVGSKKAPAAES